VPINLFETGSAPFRFRSRPLVRLGLVHSLASLSWKPVLSVIARSIIGSTCANMTLGGRVVCQMFEARLGGGIDYSAMGGRVVLFSLCPSVSASQANRSLDVPHACVASVRHSARMSSPLYTGDTALSVFASCGWYLHAA
jgi:hypothetical protein